MRVMSDFIVNQRASLRHRVFGRLARCSEQVVTNTQFDMAHKCVLPQWHNGYHKNEFGESWTYEVDGSLCASWQDKTCRVRFVPWSWRRSAVYHWGIWEGWFRNRWEIALLSDDGYAYAVLGNWTRRRSAVRAASAGARKLSER